MRLLYALLIHIIRALLSKASDQRVDVKIAFNLEREVFLQDIGGRDWLNSLISKETDPVLRV